MTTIRTIALGLALSVCAAPVYAQSVASLFTTLPADFAHLFTPTNGVIAGIGGAGSLAIHQKDREIANSVAEPSGGRHDFFRASDLRPGEPLVVQAKAAEQIGCFHREKGPRAK